MHRRPNTPIPAKHLQRKLLLHKETLTCLSPNALVKVRGGDTYAFPTCPCTGSCSFVGCDPDA